MSGGVLSTLTRPGQNVKMLPLPGLLSDPESGFHSGGRLHQWTQDPLVHAGGPQGLSDMQNTRKQYFPIIFLLSRPWRGLTIGTGSLPQPPGKSTLTMPSVKSNANTILNVEVKCAFGCSGDNKQN